MAGPSSCGPSAWQGQSALHACQGQIVPAEASHKTLCPAQDLMLQSSAAEPPVTTTSAAHLAAYSRACQSDTPIAAAKQVGKQAMSCQPSVYLRA